jgi:DNA polymerase-4
MYTLPSEFRKAEYFPPVLFKLCEMVGSRLRRKNLSGRVLSVYAHGAQGRCFSKIRRLKLELWDGREIFLQAMEIFESFKALPLACRLIGVTVGELRPMDSQQSLFGDKERSRRLAAALDGINAKYGDFTVCRAAALKAGKVFRDSIGFGRIREIGK